MSSLSIRPVAGKKETEAFIRFAWEIYKDSPAWVPPLLMDRRKLMDRAKNPFYRHAEAEFFIAWRDGRIVGRIGAIVNHNHNAEHKDKVGFFGFFECIDDQEVADALVRTAKEWLAARGMTAMRGPASPSVNDEYGLLIDGFEHSPAVLMPYNPPYYATLLEKAGLAKAKDLYAYLMREENVFSEKFARVAELVRKREDLSIRTIDMREFKAEIQRIKKLYNSAWQYNWGAVPMTEEEFDALAKDLKPVVDPRLVLIAEHKGEPVGFSLSLPDLNVPLKYNRNGGLLGGLLQMFLRKKEIKLVRIIVLGIVPEKVKTGAGTLLLYETGRRGIESGYPFGEASWVLEDNVMMNRAAEFMNGKRTKTYRIYETPL
jgi:hypothetical protein